MNWDAVIGVGDLLSLICSVILGVGLYYVNAKAGRIDRLEDALTAKTDESVKSKFEVLAAEFRGMLSQLGTVVDGIKERLERGDEKFQTQGDDQRKTELQSVIKIEGIRSWIIENFATRAEVAALSEELHQLRIRTATFEAHLAHLKGTR